MLVPYNTYGNAITPLYSSGVVSGLYSFTGTLTFTPAGASGASGPTLSQCRTAYASFGAWVSNTAYFNMTTQGNQLWTVPTTRNYTITCAGAGSGGAILTATLLLTQGHILNILVGQQTGGNNGNGGTFIKNTTTSSLLIASGGSGYGGAAASLTTTGNSGNTGGAGGTNGGSGNAGATRVVNSSSAGGCGPSDSRCSTFPAAYTTYTYTNRGGNGGGGYNQIYSSSFASFGGGQAGGTWNYDSACYYTSYLATINPSTGTPYGCGTSGANGVYTNGAYAGGGGGGGYSGGGGGDGFNYNSSGGYGGGGGGSYCSVTVTSSSVTNTGNGYVSIT